MFEVGRLVIGVACGGSTTSARAHAWRGHGGQVPHSSVSGKSAEKSHSLARAGQQWERRNGGTLCEEGRW